MAKHYSTFSIARMLRVDPGSVANWIDRELLRAHRTPGGHRRVAARDLAEFLRKHRMPVPEHLDHTPVRILVVDDQPRVTRFIAEAIHTVRPDYEVIEAPDGFRAGTLLVTRKPDVVILDLRMPGLDGYDICEQIKSDQATRQVEVLAVTAYHSAEIQRRILACGASVCLGKPLDVDALLEQVEAAVQRRRGIRAEQASRPAAGRGGKGSATGRASARS